MRRNTQLVFGSHGVAEDPKTGLALFGPYGGVTAPDVIRVGIVGNSETISLLRALLTSMGGLITPGLDRLGRPYDLRLMPDFPGFNETGPFACRFDIAQQHVESLVGMRLAQALTETSPPARIEKVIDVVTDRLSVLNDRDPAPNVVLCGIPGTIEETCRYQFGHQRKKRLTRQQKAERRWRKRSQRIGQELLFGFEKEEHDKETWDFHNALKARAMRFPFTTQLVWESTLTDPSARQDPATVAWNLATALYYKAGHIPWSLHGLPTNTAFVGVAFYRESHESDAAMRTAIAQVFSQSSEGLVLRGDRAEVDSDGDRRPHLTEGSAANLVREAVTVTAQPA